MPLLNPIPLPAPLLLTCRRHGRKLTPHILLVSVSRQKMEWLQQCRPLPCSSNTPSYGLYRRLVVSSSRFGIGQVANSNCTPLGLHHVAIKIGRGHPVGTVFESRKAVGLTWKGRPSAMIAHRILWLSGLEPGYNHGGNVDTFRRYIYIHGTGDETTLGKPASCGCIHLAARDLMPLFEQIPPGTLVWIAK